ncbi:putative tbc domain-containing protein [Botrytis fragariae]|uniref:Putative tbc domain-containing protein n=1 Tax=Botrytis fragariae TaxID=1964551 RepID=A0A8H6AKC2_9HELO|nr:putative tbc domain-containing protein [Botrytis fragariae]KAF5868911.1 putative tbc domain-containing protein [Botrytis fragariae]
MALNVQRFGSFRSIRKRSSNNTKNNINTNTNTNTGTPQVTTNITTNNEGLPGPPSELIAMRYEDMFPGARAPIPVTVAPPLSPPTDTHPAFRPRSLLNQGHELGALKKEDNTKRDSGLAPTTSTSARDCEGGSINRHSFNTVDNDNVLGININFDSKVAMAEPSSTSSTPQVQLSDVQSPASLKSPSFMKNESLGSSAGSLKRWKTKNGNSKTPTNTGKSIEISDEQFSPITTPIPGESLLEDDFMQSMSFSKRGSIMLGGRKPINAQARTNATRRQPSFSMLATTSPSIKVLSDDLEMESQKVRSMYESGSGFDWRDGKDDTIDNRLTAGGESIPERPVTANSYLTPNGIGVPQRSASALSNRRPAELAGGIEDWEDVNGKDVDRYGFINSGRTTTRPGTPEPKPPQRVSTVLQLASEAPRRKRTFGRSPSTANSQKGFRRAPSRKVSARSLKRTQGDNASIRSSRSSQLRQAANRLPGNKDRRWMDEAGDMLTLPPGLADIAEEDGEGMVFEFDTKNSKLIERTWKGIPDRWRSAAWYSFLSSSAKKREDSAQEGDIIEAFHKLQDQSSADDVQIDVDVPRTINSHIMFRRRYRGGQRLLFRVLHALSLYFPTTGYVQGMASLAATLLCYFDEEKCFVMLVRMWTLRGLEKLYEPGFPGLMAALDEFATTWLDNGEVSAKLNELGIEPTAYGTRWYLTLFNYSIPFPAQLRVWDVFMLLGDEDQSLPYSKERPFAGGLDIIHATSAALIDGTRDILLDSDFESSMKVLTSWIPVKDEELLMKVTKAEWKLHRGKKRS